MPDIRERIAAGDRLGTDVEHRNYIDGVDNLDYWTGKTDESARDEYLYYAESRLQAIRINQWKAHFFVRDGYYGGGFGTFTLKDGQGGIVSVLSDEAFDLRGLKPSVGGERPSVTRTAVFRVGHLAPVTRPGVYDVYLSVGRRDGTPQLALPLAGEDGQRRYRLGRVTLKPAD